MVILNATHAYKCPLGSIAMYRLLQLVGKQPFRSYTAGAFPLDVSQPTTFCEFQKYNPPLTVHEIHAFIEAVIKSLHILHNEAGIAHLDIWIVHSSKSKLLWREQTGVAIKTYSPTRWWSRWECTRQVMDLWGDVPKFLYNTDIAPKSKEKPTHTDHNASLCH